MIPFTRWWPPAAKSIAVRANNVDMRSLLALTFVMFAACGGSPKPVPEPTPGGNPPDPTQAAPCYKGGCGGQLCSEEEGMVSTCEFEPEHACYRSAECARQADGACGWTQTPELTECLQNPPAE